jgi:glycosyltransferase involved in cell wall biosynthesis
MKEQYEVTIGIPVYQSVDYIRDTMNSALNQSFSDIEFLIVDDCGHDGTMDVISHLQTNLPRGKDIRILVNEKNEGVSYSRNRIIDEARGRFLYFMDSDDTIEPNTIQLLYDAIIQHHVQVAYGSYEITDGIGNSPNEIYQKDALVLRGEDELAMYAFKNNHIFHVSACNHLINLEFLRQSNVRFIDASYWEDMVYTTELVTKIESAVLLPDITYHYLRRQDSLSHYQDRISYEKSEILKNASILKRLKNKCIALRGKSYLPYHCYNLEMNSFYMVCHIIQKNDRIVPNFTYGEMRMILQHPMTLKDILLFQERIVPNLLFRLIGHLPFFLFIPFIRLIGKLKKAI